LSGNEENAAPAAAGRRPRVFSSGLVMMLVVFVVLAVATWMRGGEPLVREGLGRGASLLVEFALLLVVSFLAAGLATALVPRDLIEGSLGPDSGLRGILIATGAGAITPAGPFIAMPIAATMLRSGAAAGPVVAFLTAWSILAVHRLIAWEIPIVGLNIALLRYGISIVVPILAGLVAQALTTNR
jgi:uncharacterized membrane protein YraQ (UPF0718 family)